MLDKKKKRSMEKHPIGFFGFHMNRLSKQLKKKKKFNNT